MGERGVCVKMKRGVREWKRRGKQCLSCTHLKSVCEPGAIKISLFFFFFFEKASHRRRGAVAKKKGGRFIR